MVTKRERIAAVLSGEVADRPPIALWRHFPVDDQNPALLAEATVEFQTRFDFDFVKVSPASSFCVRDWGVEDQWRGDPEGTRDYTRRAIHLLEDWPALEPLDPHAGALGEQLQCLERVRSALPPDVPIIQTIFSPLAQAKNLAGQNQLFEHLHREPEKVQVGLEVITKSTIAFVESAQERGIDGVFYAIQHGTYNLLDRQSYARFGEAYDRQVLEATSGLWLNVLHLHGEALMFDLAEHLPVQVVNWHDRDTWPNLAEGKRRLKATVCGGIRRETMVVGDPDRVREEVVDATKAVGGAGIILGTGCVVPVHAPRANLVAARGAVDIA
jgi:uroporphyrinogen decarboxylase